MPEAEYLMHDGMPVLDDRGGLVLTAKARAKQEAQQSTISQVAAAAEARLADQYEQGRPYVMSDLDAVLAARNLTAVEAIAVKRQVEKTGCAVELALWQLRLGPMPSPGKLEAAASKRLSNVHANVDMLKMIEPHARAIEAAAENMRKNVPPIGMHSDGGIVGHLRSIAAGMRSVASHGMLPSSVNHVDQATGRIMGSVAASADRVAASAEQFGMATKVANSLADCGLSASQRERLFSALTR